MTEPPAPAMPAGPSPIARAPIPSSPAPAPAAGREVQTRRDAPDDRNLRAKVASAASSKSLPRSAQPPLRRQTRAPAHAARGDESTIRTLVWDLGLRTLDWKELINPECPIQAPNQNQIRMHAQSHARRSPFTAAAASAAREAAGSARAAVASRPHPSPADLTRKAWSNRCLSHTA